jgi:hypothetical protein
MRYSWSQPVPYPEFSERVDAFLHEFIMNAMMYEDSVCTNASLTRDSEFADDEYCAQHQGIGHVMMEALLIHLPRK